MSSVIRPLQTIVGVVTMVPSSSRPFMLPSDAATKPRWYTATYFNDLLP